MTGVARPPLPAAFGPLAFPPGWDALPQGLPSGAATLPRITVVTPSFNQAPYLEATIRSVLSQQYPNLDYYVIDGGSQDGSVEIIRHYQDHLAGWVSEPDGGQVAAILKGLAMARGEWFNWINSDDLLAPGALWEVARLSAGVDVVAGVTQDFRGDQLKRRRISRNLSARNFVRIPVASKVRWHQPGIWYRTEALRATAVNPGLHYRFDLDLLVRYLREFPRVAYSDRTFAFFRLHEACKSMKHGARFDEEHRSILDQYLAEPGFADLHRDARAALVALQWRRELRGLEADPQHGRWQRAATLLRRAAQVRGAWRINATVETLGRILLRSRKRRVP